MDRNGIAERLTRSDCEGF